MKTTWLNDISLAPNPKLERDITAEVVVVGGGLAGTLSSYLLSKAGKQVVVLEKENMADSVTAYTTAWLNASIDTDLSDLIEMCGAKAAQSLWQSGMEAIDLIEKIIKDEKIDCEFKRVSHFRYARNKKEMKHLVDEHEAAEKLGFTTKLHPASQLPFVNSGSLELKDQAKFHPTKFLLGLRQAAEQYGAKFYDQTEVEKIYGGKSVMAKTKHGEVTAEFSIMTTYQPFQNPISLFAHKGMYKSYVLEVELPSETIPEGLYEDEENPYHYFRIDKERTKKQISDRMILGGEDHRQEIPGLAQKSFRALEEYLKDLLPNTKYKILKRWSGPILETIDGLPYIGRFSKKYPNRLVATGFSGNGMTYSAVAAQIFHDLILKKENPYTALFSPLRRTRLASLWQKGKDFTGEFFGGAVKNILK